MSAHEAGARRGGFQLVRVERPWVHARSSAGVSVRMHRDTWERLPEEVAEDEEVTEQMLRDARKADAIGCLVLTPLVVALGWLVLALVVPYG